MVGYAPASLAFIGRVQPTTSAARVAAGPRSVIVDMAEV